MRKQSIPGPLLWSEVGVGTRLDNHYKTKRFPVYLEQVLVAGRLSTALLQLLAAPGMHALPFQSYIELLALDRRIQLVAAKGSYNHW